MNLRSKTDQDFERLVDTFNAIQEERINSSQEIEHLRASTKSLLAIENEALKLLGIADAHGVDGLGYSDFAPLQKACGWVFVPKSSVPSVPLDDLWDRKPGRRYVAKTSLCCGIQLGDVVEVVPKTVKNWGWAVRNLRTGTIIASHMFGLDEQSWRLPTAEENAPKPEGTAVTSFEDLKIGDKVRIERKRGDVPQVGFPAVQNDYVLEDTLAQFYDDSWGKWWGTTEGHCLDLREVTNGRVRLLSSAKRKPFVRDGRWVAEVGDRFHARGNMSNAAVEVVAINRSSGTYTLKDQGITTPGWNLNAETWEPVS